MSTIDLSARLGRALKKEKKCLVMELKCVLHESFSNPYEIS